MSEASCCLEFFLCPKPVLGNHCFSRQNLHRKRGLLLLCVAHVYCVIGEGATRHWNSTGKPFNYKHGLGMTLAEYTSHLSVWYVCSVSLP